jgi:hypothetical protein
VGDLSSTITGFITIYNGTNCGSGTFSGAEIGEYYSTFSITGISPATSSTQQYEGGGDATPIYACP